MSVRIALTFTVFREPTTLTVSPGEPFLSHLVDQSAGGQRKHQARDSAEEHADPHKRADDPFGARWPGPPNHNGKDQGDDSVE